MAERRAKVLTKVGLHARPAALFVQAAGKFGGDVTVARPGSTPVNAKSILSVLALDAHFGEELLLEATGNGDEELLDRLSAIVSGEASA